MKKSNRVKKEKAIIDAAEKVFSKLGFKNTKMEDISEQACITKVTLYSYFQSKENLYLAITYRGLTLLNDLYQKTIKKYKNEPGLNSVLALIKVFMDFSENHFFYSEALLEYFAMVRATASGENTAKLTKATKDSIFYKKIQEIQNVPFKLTVKEIIRGQEDGSILEDIDPMVMTIHGWTMVIGYSKVLSASGSNTSPLFNVNLDSLKQLNLSIAKALLSSHVVRKEINKDRTLEKK